MLPTMNNRLIIGGVVLVAVIIVIWFMNMAPAKAPIGQICTMDVKLCPDGSYVSRTEPNCEFAQCPAPSGNTISISIGAKATINDITIGVLELIEDSRCPEDVVCIWAGTVKVRATLQSGLGTADQIFEIGIPITTESETVTLVGVNPIPRAGKDIGVEEYVFSFEVRKRN